MVRIVVLALSLGCLLSCVKMEGEGGNARIHGKLKVYDVNAFGDTTATYYGQEEDVYILYGGDDLTYDDRFRTSQDGSFEFKYLRKGNYTVFAYSDCRSCASGNEVISYTVNLDKNNSEVEIPELEVVR